MAEQGLHSNAEQASTTSSVFVSVVSIIFPRNIAGLDLHSAFLHVRVEPMWLTEIAEDAEVGMDRACSTFQGTSRDTGRESLRCEVLTSAQAG